MKRIFTLFAFLGVFGFAQAQLADGVVVQDFTVTDINGNTHQLYDILNEGKSVILDVFATWCGPCWSYHNAHHLKDVWEEYGPDGTDEIFVMAIEADGSTPLDALYGIGGGTLGDWTAGVPYPIVNDASMNSFLNINYFPTIYMICQDRTIREAGQINATSMYNFHNQCAKPVGDHNAGMSEYKGYDDVVCGDFSFTPRVRLTNQGAEIMTEATLTASVNGAIVSTVNWEGNLYAFENELVYFDEIDISPGDEIDLEIVDVNGQPDEDAADNAHHVSVEVPAEVHNNTLKIEVKTDDKGHEIFWAVLNPDQTILAKGGNNFVGLWGGGLQNLPPLGGYDDNTLFEEYVTLPSSGCYKFVIVDNWGDGLSSPGYFKVTNGDEQIIYEGADFGALTSRTLDVEFSTGTTEISELAGMEVYPNPTASDVTVSLELTETINAELRVVDLTGKAIQTQNLGQLNSGIHNLNVSMTNIPVGIYYVELVSETGIQTEKVVKF